jgi:hypothetical protein
MLRKTSREKDREKRQTVGHAKKDMQGNEIDREKRQTVGHAKKDRQRDRQNTRTGKVHSTVSISVSAIQKVFKVKLISIINFS